MANLLVVSNYPDEQFKANVSMFVYLQIQFVRRYFDNVYVLAPTPYVPRALAPLGKRWPRIAQCLAKRDYSYENVRVFFPRYLPWVGHQTSAKRVAHTYPILLRTLRRHGLMFDLIHGHMSPNGWYVAQMSQDFHVPGVLTVHENHDTLMSLLKAREAELVRGYRDVTEMIRVSPFDIADIQEVCGPRKIHYIPNGFDPTRVPAEDRATLRRQLHLPLDRPIFVSVALWEPRKDPLILMEALRRLVASGRKPQPLWVLVGDMHMAGPVQEKIDADGLGAHVIMTGLKPPNEVLRYMKASDAVVLFSHSEGNPTVMFEALGCGRPYIGSDVGGVRAVLTDDRLGLAGPPRDLEVATRLLQQALDRQWDEEYIIQHARQYSWQAIAERINNEIYQPLLARRGFS